MGRIKKEFIRKTTDIFKELLVVPENLSLINIYLSPNYIINKVPNTGLNYSINSLNADGKVGPVFRLVNCLTRIHIASDGHLLEKDEEFQESKTLAAHGPNKRISFNVSDVVKVDDIIEGLQVTTIGKSIDSKFVKLLTDRLIRYAHNTYTSFAVNPVVSDPDEETLILITLNKDKPEEQKTISLKKGDYILFNGSPIDCAAEIVKVTPEQLENNETDYVLI